MAPSFLPDEHDGSFTSGRTPRTQEHLSLCHPLSPSKTAVLPGRDRPQRCSSPLGMCVETKAQVGTAEVGSFPPRPLLQDELSVLARRRSILRPLSPSPTLAHRARFHAEKDKWRRPEAAIPNQCSAYKPGLSLRERRITVTAPVPGQWLQNFAHRGDRPKNREFQNSPQRNRLTSNKVGGVQA